MCGKLAVDDRVSGCGGAPGEGDGLFPSHLHGHACVFSRFSHVRLFATPWTVAHQAPLFLGFSRQEYWSGLPGEITSAVGALTPCC